MPLSEPILPTVHPLPWIHSQKHFLVEGKSTTTTSTTTTTKMITLVYVEKKHMDKEVIMGETR